MKQSDIKKNLDNTWGVVESGEHVKYLKMFAEFHGIPIVDFYPPRIKKFFEFNSYEGELTLSFSDARLPCSFVHEREISLPMPPKSRVTSGAKNENPELDEWPYKKGDKVVYPSGKGTLVIDVPDSNGVIITLDDNGSYKRVSASGIQKPETTELEQAIKTELLTEISGVTQEFIQKLFDKYNVTPKNQ